MEVRRILLLEDDDAHAEIIKRSFEGLDSLFRLDHATTLGEARAALGNSSYELVISDWNLPDGQGIELLPVNSEESPYAVLLMTSHGTEQMAVRALKAGSADYVVKSEATLSDMPHLAERALREWDGRVARRHAEEAIRASLREKEAMLQEIHHRVKNNLQIVCSLLQLQASEIQNEQLLRVFEASQTRIRSMALIHEMLYQSDSLAKIDLEAYLQGLSQMLLASSFKGTVKPRLEVLVSGCAVSIETAIPLGLIANELITNALKYAFPDDRQGTLRVACKSLPDGERLFSVSDDGVGLPTTVEIEKCTSLGLKLVGMFTRKLRGQGEWNRERAGTEYQLRFRELPQRGVAP